MATCAKCPYCCFIARTKISLIRHLRESEVCSHLSAKSEETAEDTEPSAANQPKGGQTLSTAAKCPYCPFFGESRPLLLEHVIDCSHAAAALKKPTKRAGVYHFIVIDPCLVDHYVTFIVSVQCYIQLAILI